MFPDNQAVTINNSTFYNIEGDFNLVSPFPSAPPVWSAAEVAKISKWFTTINFRNTQNDTIKVHTRGTGRWLLDGDEFKTWMEGDREGNTLWVAGMPGAGKTILSSIVVDHLQTKAKEAPGVVVMVVYCRYHDELSVQDILASLARQMTDSNAVELDFPAIQTFYNMHQLQGTQPTASSLLELLGNLFTKFLKVFISIDALDEITDEVKEEVLDALSRLRANCFITSRPLDSFQELLPNTRPLRLESEVLNNYDIELFIMTKIDAIPRLREMCKGKSDLKSEICRRLKEKSAGMFLLCSLQVNMLRRVITIKRLWEAIKSLPSGINDMYQSTWQRILSQAEDEVDLAKRAFTFITHAKRPLGPTELRQALSVSVETGTSDPDDVPGMDLLLHVSCGLITLDEGNQIVRLAHYTTHDFFRSLGPQLWPSPHAFLATTCVSHLSSFRFPNRFLYLDEFSEKRQRHYLDGVDPFFHYAYDYWAVHARDHEAAGQLPKALLDIVTTWARYPFEVEELRGVGDMIDIVGLPHLVAHFGFSQILPSITSFKDERSFKFGWLPIHFAAVAAKLSGLKDLVNAGTDVNSITDSSYSSGHGLSDGRTPLILASRLNHPKIIEFLLSHPDIDVNIRDREGKSALVYTIVFRHTECLKLLLSHPQIDINLQNDGGDTPLMLALAIENPEPANLLLSRPEISLNLANKYGDSALTAAASADRTDFVRQLLLRPEIVVDWRDSLRHATQAGHTETVKLLLSHDKIDVNHVDGGGPCALSMALVRGHLEIAHLLLSHPKTDVNSQNEEGLGPLASAAAHNRVEFARILLTRPEINVRWCFALHEAAWYGGVESVRFLLTRPEIDVNLRRESGDTALINSMHSGSIDTVQLFLSHPKIDVNVVDDSGKSALILAASLGQLNLVKLLLSHPEIDVKWGTALVHAASHDLVDIVGFLLSRDEIDVNLPNDSGGTALIEAIIWHNTAVVQLLLSHPKIDVNFPDSSGHSPLTSAAAFGNLYAAHALLAHPDIKVNWNTALIRAVCLGHPEGVGFLLAIPEVDVNIRDEKGDTALIKTSGHKHRISNSYIAKLLLSHPNVDVNAQNNAGASTLSLAVSVGDFDLVQLLLSHPEIDVNLVDETGATPLTFANSKGYVEIVQLLLAHPRIDLGNMGQIAITHMAERDRSDESVHHLSQLPATVSD